MKRAVRSLVLVLVASVILTGQALAQKDEERMNRDLKVAENILSTLIKQKLGKRNFFPVEVNAAYRAGYGVTFNLPLEISGPLVWGITSPERQMLDGNRHSQYFEFQTEEPVVVDRILDEDGKVTTETIRGAAMIAQRRKESTDSIRTATNEKLIEACKEFLADYGDLISQLQANEKIIITNRSDRQRDWFIAMQGEMKPTYLSIETTKGEVAQLKQGKVSREQFMKNLKVLNTQTDSELQPDLELLTSIFNRLYRRDLSKSFFTDENIYYERLKDYGVIYYMNVFSSNQINRDRWVIPTLGLNNLSQEERDKKVKELYPVFEQSIKADILEYGRTVKSLKANEVLVFNIALTRCQGCGIPATLELSIKSNVLSDYTAGKISKDAALGKFEVTKGNSQ
ncbi:MAG: hypothetical protein DYG99_08210 [Bacteroidetes bacterium CHB5]|nr:hypothetical protein [Bacteroidetes bacterium CHB5]